MVEVERHARRLDHRLQVLRGHVADDAQGQRIASPVADDGPAGPQVPEVGRTSGLEVAVVDEPVVHAVVVAGLDGPVVEEPRVVRHVDAVDVADVLAGPQRRIRRQRRDVEGFDGVLLRIQVEPLPLDVERSYDR